MYQKDTKSFITMISNGWLHTPQKSINKVYEVINQMILEKKTESEPLNIFHAKTVKEFIENITSFGVEIMVLDNTVCSLIKINVNINYDELTDGEYYNLRQKIKQESS